MSTTFEVETTINHPADQVWATLTDWEKAPAWMNGIDSIRAEGDTAVGTKIVFHTRGKDRTSEIVQCEPGREVVLRSVQGGVTADYAYRLEPVGESATKVSLVADCTSEGLMWKVMSPMISIAMKMSDGGQLEALKKVMGG